jgi:hypothetical protein
MKLPIKFIFLTDWQYDLPESLSSVFPRGSVYRINSNRLKHSVNLKCLPYSSVYVSMHDPNRFCFIDYELLQDIIKRKIIQVLKYEEVDAY